MSLRPLKPCAAYRSLETALGLVGCLLVSSSVSANPEPMLTEADLLGNIATISIASRLEQTPAQAPASVTIIDREMIRASGALNWVDVFRLVPGFQAYAPNANRYGISYHGQGRELPNHLEVMVDGRSVYDPIQSTVIWGALGIDFDDIDHIEVVRGSSAAAHGSNAFVGAVNIITRKPIQDQGTRLKAIVGEDGTRETTLRHSAQIGAADYRLSLGHRRDDGFPDFDAFGPDDGEEAWHINLRSTYTPSLSDTLDIDVGFSRQDTEFGDADRTEEYIPIRYDSQYQRLAWQRLISDKSSLQLQFYRNHLQADGSRNFGLLSQILNVPPESIVVFPGILIPDQSIIQGFDSLESERYDLEGSYRYRFSDHFNSIWGFGARHETVDSATFTSSKSIDEQTWRFFAHGQWSPLDQWTVNAGAMVEKTRVGTLLSPRVSLNYALTPDHTLRVSLAQGRRGPSISETNERNLFALNGGIVAEDIRRTEALDEEQISSIELGYVGHFPELGLSIDINLFREEIRDGLDDYREVIPPTAFLDAERLVRDNVADWNTTGAELQLTYRPGSRTFIRLHYAYADIDSTRIDSFNPWVTKDFDEGTPQHSGGLLVNHQLTQNFDLGFFAQYQTDVDWRNGNFTEQFTRFDAQATYRFQVGTSEATLQLVGQNLFDDYSEFNEENLFETKVFLRAQIELPD
ncbi:MAG: TonB-dependent receptor [Porticoccaceae bacterium]|nr:TonB-dependent receptor [Porticoccaceae bacterium]